MKKLWEQIKEKALSTIVMSMLGIGGAFLYNTGKDLWNLPGTVKELKQAHTQDSLKAIKYIIRIDSISKILGDHEKFLEQDYKSIQKIKTKLKI